MATITVDAAGAGDFTTIQAAIAASQNGDLIIVNSGTYDENLTIDKDITLIGANTGVAAGSTRGAESQIDGAVTITSPGVRLDGFSITGSLGGGNEDASVFILGNNARITNNLISADATAQTGIVVSGGVNNAAIEGNTISGFASFGVYANPNSGAATITNNAFVGNNEGVTFEAGPSVDDISANAFSGSGTNDIRVSLRTSGTFDLTGIVGANTYSGGTVNQVNVRASGLSTVTGTDLGDRIEQATIGSYENIGGPVIFNGGLGNDTLIGGSGDDTLTGGAGNDSLFGGLGTPDTAIFSGARSSYTIAVGANGVFTVTGLDGVDTVSGVENLRFDDATITGQNLGEGNDTVVTNDDSQFVVTGAGDDTVTAGNGANFISTGTGDDTVTAGNGGNTVAAGSGDDTVTTGSAFDVVFGGTGDDTISTGDFQDFAFGQSGDDTLLGGAGNDFLLGGTGQDVLNGGAGVDLASYRDASASVVANLLNSAANTGDATGDTYISIEGLEGSNFVDALGGNAASNLLVGLGGQDYLYGVDGNDTLEGGDGNDFLFGGADQDYLTGGAGQDVFVFEANGGNDIVLDFQVSGAEADFLDFEGFGVDFSDITITDIAGGQQVTFDGGPTINVSIAGGGQLTQSNFLFDLL